MEDEGLFYQLFSLTGYLPLGIFYTGLLFSLLYPLQPVYFRPLLRYNLLVARAMLLPGALALLALLLYAFGHAGSFPAVLFIPAVFGTVALAAAVFHLLSGYKRDEKVITRTMLLCLLIYLLYLALNSELPLNITGSRLLVSGAVYQAALMLWHFFAGRRHRHVTAKP